MKQKKHWIILWVIIALIVTAFLYRLGYLSGSDDEVQADGRSDALKVEARILEKTEHSNTFRTTGDIRPGEQVELRAEIAGKIESINFEEGTHVEQGRLLVKIDDDELQADLERLRSRENVLSKREERQSRLLEIEAISEENYENTYHELQGIRAEIAQVRSRIDKTEIRAPFDGTVGIREVSPGSFVSSETRIASLVQHQPLKIRFSIPERYAGSVREGDSVSFSIAGSNEQYRAGIYALQPFIDQNTRSLRVQALFNNGDGTVIPGAFARIEATVSTPEPSVSVPSEALIPDIEGHYVYLYKDGIAERQDVRIGQRMEENVQILEGLEEGDTLLTTGILQLREGRSLEISSFRNQ